jgi:hopanoid biosynthesis associated radical SAM protein HpnH
MRFPLGLTLSLGSYMFRNRMMGRRMFPLVLMLEPLHACNLSCVGCGRIREYANSLDQTMTVQQCTDAVQQCGAPIVSICGGEPLIYDHIGELVRELVNAGRSVYLCTNGQALSRKLSEFAPSSRLILNVHIDGQEKTHDAITGRPGAFAAALKGITEATRQGFLVSTNTTIYRQTDMADVEGLFGRLAQAGVNTHMISPGYDYDAVGDGNLFLTRQETAGKFKGIDDLAKRFPIGNTPLYLEFLQGKRDFPCTAWGNPTRNPAGWRSPCYMLADRHFETFPELMRETDWEAYGPGRDERCKDCMVHCGFEPSAVLGPGKRLRDIFRLAVWQMS